MITLNPFNDQNYDASDADIKLINDAFNIAAQATNDWLDETFIASFAQDRKLVNQLQKSLEDAIGSAFNSDFTAGEIADLAMRK